MSDPIPVIAFVVYMIGGVCGILLGHALGMEHYQEQAIEQGYAEYNQTTGDWQWKRAKDE